MTLSKTDLLRTYELMLRLRRFEEKAANLYQQGQIGGFCHLYIGQEAVLAGCKAATEVGDDYITSYRCHAHAIACGVEPKAVMAELTGRADGISKGKGGSMHMFEPSLHFWGGHGIVGAQAPLGAGLAFAAKYRGEKRICLTFLGDGAMNEGAVFESFNMAALWQLPVLFVVENNEYGMGTSVARAAAGKLHERGRPFGMPVAEVDGMDVLAVYDAVKKAADAIRAGNGPQVLEMKTYRYRGHSMSDPAKYRTRDEVDNMKTNRDPISNLGALLTSKHKVGDADLKALDKKIKEEMAEVVEFSLQAPEPAETELYTDILPA